MRPFRYAPRGGSKHARRRSPLRAVCLVLAFLATDAGVALADCRTVAVTAQGRPVMGIEDLVVDAPRGQAVLSAYDRSAAPDRAGGGLFLLPLADLKAGAGEARDLSAAFHPEGGFRPHGIDLRAESDGSRSLLVINRRTDGRTVVERFTLDGDGLRHRGTVDAPLLCRANEVAFLDGDRFLFTSDHGACGWAGVAVENVLNRHRGFVGLVGGLVEGDTARVLAAGIGFPNGLLPDPAADRLFVAATRERAVLVYRLSALLDGSGAEPLERIPLPGGPDNLSRTPDGRILAAVHASLFALALHRYGLPGGATAPSRIVALRPDGAEILLEDDGRGLSAATVAAGWDDRVIAGSVMSDRLLLCDGGSSGASRSSRQAERPAPK